jgi:hypothetical protein
MLSSLRSYTLNAVHVFGSARLYSTPVGAVTNVGKTAGAPGALRPHLNVSVNPNHGLYAFFRKREKDGKVIHDYIEDHAGLHDIFGKVIAPVFRVIALMWLQVDRGPQQNFGEKASGISTHCGMSFWESVT